MLLSLNYNFVQKPVSTYVNNKGVGVARKLEFGDLLHVVNSREKNNQWLGNVSFLFKVLKVFKRENFVV